MWRNIIGQDKVKEKLKSIYKSNKISHAYLFHGMEGVGKDAAAIEFAKLLNCQNKSNGEACDVCEECRSISALRSEHFNIVCSLPAGKSEQTDSDPLEKLSAEDFENYLEQIKLKSENHYKRINIPNANNIRINSIREIINKIYLSTGRKHKKVFLISEADKMTLEASNALLKILEEPPKKSVIILTTSKPNALLPTVIGRCHQIHFEKLPEPLIQEKLIKEFEKTRIAEKQSTEYNDIEIKLASKLSMGSYSRASALLEMDINEIRDTAINYLISVIKNDYAEMVCTI
ncbi:MAG: ATP-binding protein, partial [Ignavibacteria bacterium]